MTPDLKAQNLIDTFRDKALAPNVSQSLEDKVAIQCSIICVEKLIEEHTFKYPFRWNTERIKHWQSVLTILKSKI